MYMKRNLLLLFLVTLGCQEAKVQPGELGGECRIGGSACLDDLVCLDGRCQIAPDEPERPNLNIEFSPFSTRTLPADGQAEFDFALRVTDADSGEPYVGNLLLYPHPSTAGRIAPGEVRFEDGLQGLGGATYTACRENGVDECPEYVFFQAALPDDPFNPIAQSEVIKLLRRDAPDEPIETACTQPGGLLALKAHQGDGEESTVTIEASDIRVDRANELLTLNPPGLTTTMRVDLGNSSTGRRTLRRTDVQLRAGDRFELSAPCGVSPLAFWSGFMDVIKLEQDEAGEIIEFSMSFEIACLGDDDSVSLVRGCAYLGEP